MGESTFRMTDAATSASGGVVGMKPTAKTKVAPMSERDKKQYNRQCVLDREGPKKAHIAKGKAKAWTMASMNFFIFPTIYGETRDVTKSVNRVTGTVPYIGPFFD